MKKKKNKMSFILFAQIGVNGNTICEINWEEKTRSFSIYWIRREFKGLLDVKYYDCDVKASEWLHSLALIMGFNEVSFVDILKKKQTEIDFKPFGGIEKLQTPWAGFHNSDPYAVYEISLCVV